MKLSVNARARIVAEEFLKNVSLSLFLNVSALHARMDAALCTSGILLSFVW